MEIVGSGGFNECQYKGCGKLFESKRRWTKKYCCDSCRVMASRERKYGLGGTLENKPRSKGVNDLFELTKEQHMELKLNYGLLKEKFDKIEAEQAKTQNWILELAKFIGTMSGQQAMLDMNLKSVMTRVESIQS